MGLAASRAALTESLSAFAGRVPMIRADIDMDWVTRWIDHRLCTPLDRMGAAYIEIRLIEVSGTSVASGLAATADTRRRTSGTGLLPRQNRT